MAEEQKKRRGRRAYLDDFQKTASGEYVYNGKMHYYQSEHMGRKKAIFVLWLLIPPLKALFPNPVYPEWGLAVVTFILCMILDKRSVEIPDGDLEAIANR